MQPLLDEICKRCDNNERVALCTVVGSRGSTPQAKGAKMLVLADGTTLGTLGGGCVEAEVRKLAITLLIERRIQTAGVPARSRLRLGRWPDLRRNHGHLRPGHRSCSCSNLSATIRDALASSRGTVFRIPYELAGAAEGIRRRAWPPADARDRRRGPRWPGARRWHRRSIFESR